MAENTCMTSSPSSPEQRPSSPTLSVSPSLALDAVPRLDRAVSTPSTSTASSLSTSTPSRPSRASDGATTVIKRRGYMRPQGTAFADSARNRDSVMSLGSIAHMQYYFARTGLLDGKGGQLAKEREKKKTTINSSGNKENWEPSGAELDDWGISSLCLNDTNAAYAISDSGLDPSVVESPSELTDHGDFWSSVGAPMLPPTVSTYKQKPSYTEPLPDMPVLRRELKEALQDACKVLEETQKSSAGEESDGFYEIQGLHLLDIMTLAIRAAKNYYTAHTDPTKLYAIKPEKTIRADLYKVLDVLKRMASRNFRGGVRISELTDIILWIESIDKLLKREEEREEAEAAERESWIWRDGDWSGREREREWLFLKSFDKSSPPLAQWPERPDGSADSPAPNLPTDFHLTLQDGQRLIQLHNTLVSRSKRNFGEIKTWHTDVGKPYRMAENLRFWMKASELRWETKLIVPVLDVVGNKDGEAWRLFDEALFVWARHIRTELMEEWRVEALSNRRRMPELKVEVPENGASDALDPNSAVSGPVEVLEPVTNGEEEFDESATVQAVPVDIPGTTSTQDAKADASTTTPAMVDVLEATSSNDGEMDFSSALPPQVEILGTTPEPTNTNDEVVMSSALPVPLDVPEIATNGEEAGVSTALPIAVGEDALAAPVEV